MSKLPTFVFLRFNKIPPVFNSWPRWWARERM